MRFDKEAENTLGALGEAMGTSVGIMDFLLRRIIDKKYDKVQIFSELFWGRMSIALLRNSLLSKADTNPHQGHVATLPKIFVSC